jgi:hypothetical protein
MPKIEPDRPRPKKEAVPSELDFKFLAQSEKHETAHLRLLSMKRHISGISIKVHVVGGC